MVDFIPYEELTDEQRELVDDPGVKSRIMAVLKGYALDRLARDRSPYVRAEVAKRGFSLDQMINDKTWWVRSEVIHHNYGLDRLAGDDQPKVRFAVAEYLEDAGMTLSQWAERFPEQRLTSGSVASLQNQLPVIAVPEAAAPEPEPQRTPTYDQPRSYAQPEPAWSRPEPAYGRPEPAYTPREQAYTRPEPAYSPAPQPARDPEPSWTRPSAPQQQAAPAGGPARRPKAGGRTRKAKLEDEVGFLTMELSARVAARDCGPDQCHLDTVTFNEGDVQFQALGADPEQTEIRDGWLYSRQPELYVMSVDENGDETDYLSTERMSLREVKDLVPYAIVMGECPTTQGVTSISDVEIRFTKQNSRRSVVLTAGKMEIEQWDDEDW